MNTHLIQWNLCLLLSIIPNFPQVTNSAKDTQQSVLLLWQTARALENILNYFERNYKEINLDSIIGTRIVEGQVKLVLDHLKQTDHPVVSNEFLLTLHDIESRAGSISKASMPYVARSAPSYYQKIGVILKKGFWELWLPGHDADPNLVTPALVTGEAMQEGQSDDCLAEFFGTMRESKEKCVISDHCWTMMTTPGLRGYSLSHQVFYMEIGHQFGCGSEMEKKAMRFRQTGGVLFLVDKICSNVLAEAKEIAMTDFPDGRQDLFMEQAALCGMMGYRQFFNSIWLRNILSWQDASGCYKVGPSELIATAVVSKHHNRVKREEKLLDGGCLCHRTTVAAAALSQYLRYIIEYLELEQTLQKDTFLI